MKRVLFVDDELQILKSIRRIFPGKAFEVLCADSAQAALTIMAETPVDMIVSDMRMPNMDGVELLTLVKERYPDTMRLILSGYADEDEIMATIRDNVAKAYMFKPWDNNELVHTITQNLENSGGLPAQLISFINNKHQLPTTPRSYQRIIRAIEEHQDFDAVIGEIIKDQTISAKVLQMVNSAYYGNKTGSVKKAVSFLGLGDLKSLIMSLEVLDCLKAPGQDTELVDKIGQASYYTSRLQHMITDRFLHKSIDHFEAGAGLLHKIGIVLLLSYEDAPYLDLLQHALVTGTEALWQLERAAYGYNHSEVSVYLLKWWNIPGQIIAAAANYMDPLAAEEYNRALCCIVHIAQHYAGIQAGLGPFCDLKPQAFDYLGIDRVRFEENYKEWGLI